MKQLITFELTRLSITGTKCWKGYDWWSLKIRSAEMWGDLSIKQRTLLAKEGMIGKLGRAFPSITLLYNIFLLRKAAIVWNKFTAYLRVYHHKFSSKSLKIGQTKIHWTHAAPCRCPSTWTRSPHPRSRKAPLSRAPDSATKLCWNEQRLKSSWYSNINYTD